MGRSRTFALARRGKPTRLGAFALCLRRDQRGASIIEFALVALPFFALLVAILQTSLTFFVQGLVESAAEAAGRQLMTGQAQTQGLSQAQFKALTCSQLPSFLSCSNLIVDVQQAGSFAGVSTTAPIVSYDPKTGKPTNGQYSPGGAGQVTILRVMYIWSEQKGPLGFDLSNQPGGNRLLVATSVFKTEPYLQ
jgi:Flp pilus assembly protein TadG